VAGIAVADINPAAAEKVAEECQKLATNKSFIAMAIQVDVCDAKSVEQMVKRTIAEFGRIDYSVNSAGVRSHHFGSYKITLTIVNSLAYSTLLRLQIHPWKSSTSSSP
jgi:NAD(P)-dependent dehydrogenase (short-subunit alcohol dehydrogenase family)